MRKTGRGITIVSLVVTIIILLILATVSIQSLTHTGMFASANKAKLDTKRSQISEWLGLEVISEQTNNPKGSAEQIINQTHKNVLDKQEELKRFGKDIKVEDVRTEEDGEQVDVYFYVVVDKDIYKVDLKNHKFIGELGKMLPVIKIVSISNTTNSVKVKVKTSRNEGGSVEYYIKSEDDTRYTLKATKNDDSEYVYENLIQGKKYSVKVVAKAENGQSAEAIAEQTTGTIINLKEGDLEFTSKPSTWTNTDVEVTVKANIDIKGYQLLTSQNPDKGWNKATSQIFKTNGIIYAVLSDGVNYGVAASRTIQNIDKTKPVVTGATATTNKIAITATDEASEIIGYAVTTSNTEPSSFTDVASTKTLSVESTGYKQGTTYYVWVKDKAGNVSNAQEIKTTIIAVAEITVLPNTATLKEGETVKLTATISPNDAYNKSVTWYSEDESIATVESDGTVTAISEGNVKIFASSESVLGYCSLTVTSAEYHMLNENWRLNSYQYCPSWSSSAGHTIYMTYNGDDGGWTYGGFDTTVDLSGYSTMRIETHTSNRGYYYFSYLIEKTFSGSISGSRGGLTPNGTKDVDISNYNGTYCLQLAVPVARLCESWIDITLIP